MLTVCFSTWKSSSVPCTIVTVSMPTCVHPTVYTLAEGHGVQLLRDNWLRTASRRESLLVVLRTTVCHHSEHRCRHMLCKEPEPHTDQSFALFGTEPRAAAALRAILQPQRSPARMGCSRCQVRRLLQRCSAHCGGVHLWNAELAITRMPHCVSRSTGVATASDDACQASSYALPFEWAGAVAAGGGGCPASSWRSSGGDRAKEGTVQLWDRRACS